jgi:rhomboid family GlyGly-CTERM serine protease
VKFRLPFLTLALAALALLIHLVPGAAAGMQYDRAAIAGGEWWRLLTGHLAHFSANHLVWDVGMLLALGFAAERESAAGCAYALGLASVAISAAIWVAQPQFVIYRGLSGLDCALGGFLAGSLLRRPQRIAVLAGAATLLFVGAKAAFEAATGSTAFANGVGYAPVPLAHLVGLAVGALVALLSGGITTISSACTAHQTRSPA